MMYGIGLPILFPIAATSLIVLYVMEKLLVFYSYRLPPSYDQLLSDNALYILRFPPMFMLGLGYWMFSNK